ncbi:MAG: AmmeMemoRadiSam system protein A [Acidimicrobiales bacterium]
MSAPDDVGAAGVAAPDLGDDDRRALLDLAVTAIRARLEGQRLQIDHARLSPTLAAPGASFVTLREGDRLLGCIGTIQPTDPLADDVAHNAEQAAFADPRLPALTPTEFEVMEVKVSVLSPLERLAVRSPAELAAVVVPGADGLLLDSRRAHGTFLPSVWEQLPSVDDFLHHLWRKAGLRPFAWPDDLQVLRYRTLEFGDPGPRPPIQR